MAIIVGQVARKDNFWNRESELEEAWDVIESHGHVLLVAPRRSGKTSIMYKILDDPKENYIPIYIYVGSVYSENEFWEKLFQALMDEEFINHLEVYAKSWWDTIKGIRIKKISLEGEVEFADGEKVSYKKAFYRLIKDIDSDKKIIIMLDEFAQTLENIIEYESEKNALNLLNTHRNLRHDSKISEKITLIYAGSIGLETIVSKMNETKLINDLHSIKVSPLSSSEATNFVKHLAQNNSITISDEIIKYMLQEVEWLIPFYIQLVLQETKKVSRREKRAIDNSSVDQAITNAIGHKQYFESWRSKLEEGMAESSYVFAKKMLNIISRESIMALSDTIALASEYDISEDRAKGVLGSLVYDGYINNSDEAETYRFNSPILRKWWYRYVN